MADAFPVGPPKNDASLNLNFGGVPSDASGARNVGESKPRNRTPDSTSPVDNPGTGAVVTTPATEI